MSKIKDIISSPYVVWLVLAWPSLPLIWDLYENNRYYAEIMHLTGVLSVQLLVGTLAISPASLLLKRWESGKHIALWLIKNRRYFGVAGFAYGLLHLIFYIRETYSLYVIYLEFFDIAIFFGWLGFIFLLPAFLTSNAYSVRHLGLQWKRLQQLSYLAIVAIFIHWIYFDFFWDEVLTWLAVLGVAKTIHIVLKNTKSVLLKAVNLS